MAGGTVRCEMDLAGRPEVSRVAAKDGGESKLLGERTKLPALRCKLQFRPLTTLISLFGQAVRASEQVRYFNNLMVRYEHPCGCVE